MFPHNFSISLQNIVHFSLQCFNSMQPKINLKDGNCFPTPKGVIVSVESFLSDAYLLGKLTNPIIFSIELGVVESAG